MTSHDYGRAVEDMRNKYTNSKVNAKSKVSCKLWGNQKDWRGEILLDT